MTEKEVIEKIIETPKFYYHANPPIKQSNASAFIISWRKGMAKRKTIEEFLAKFGYYVSQERQFKKLEGKPSNLKTK